MQRSHLILIDNREKTPLIFPPFLTVAGGSLPWSPSGRTVSLHTQSKRLPTGDYILSEHPSRGCVERKAHLSELHQNLFSERRYLLFADELKRLRDHFSHPLVLIEGSPSRPLPVKPGLPSADLILDTLMGLLSRYTVPVLFLDASTVDARRNVAQIVARHLLHAAYGDPPCSSSLSPPKSPPPTSTPPVSSPAAVSPSSSPSPPWTVSTSSPSSGT